MADDEMVPEVGGISDRKCAVFAEVVVAGGVAMVTVLAC